MQQRPQDRGRRDRRRYNAHHDHQPVVTIITRRQLLQIGQVGALLKDPGREIEIIIVVAQIVRRALDPPRLLARGDRRHAHRPPLVLWNSSNKRTI
jgi:hypothetical protein